MTKSVLTTRQQLAEQLAAFIRTCGGWATNPLPLRDSDHLRFEVRLSDNKLPSDLKRLGFELRLLSQSTRLDPWAMTEIIRVGNAQQLRQQSYAGFWVTRRSGGVVCRHLDDLDAVLEFDACDDLRQVICTFESPPGL